MGWSGQGGYEPRIEVIVKMQKIKLGGGGCPAGGGGRGLTGGCQGGYEPRISYCEDAKKSGAEPVGGGGEVRVDVNEEM